MGGKKEKKFMENKTIIFFHNKYSIELCCIWNKVFKVWCQKNEIVVDSRYQRLDHTPIHDRNINRSIFHKLQHIQYQMNTSGDHHQCFYSILVNIKVSITIDMIINTNISINIKTKWASVRRQFIEKSGCKQLSKTMNFLSGLLH